MEPGRKAMGPSRDIERNRPSGAYATAAIVAVVLILVAKGATMDPGSATHGPCTNVTVVSSSEKAALLLGIARAYDREAFTIAGSCAHVDVVAKPSGEAADALVAGWDQSVDGPRPDVWTPVTTSWLEIAGERLSTNDGADLIPADVGHVATGPSVIAMPRPMAEAMGWPKVQIGWRDLFALAQDPAGWGRFGHPEWGAFRLGKTNPEFSTSGLNALIGEYYAATGTSSDLTEAGVSDARVVEFVKGVESSVVHYGDISITFLENLRRADEAGRGLTYVSAVAIEEKSVWDYNQGNPSGDPATLGDQAPPSTPLVAVYPREGTLVNDHPYAILDAPWVSPDERAVAEDFLRFVQAPDQQERFQAAGFRDFRGEPGDQVNPDNGLLPNQPKVELETPAAPVLDEIQRSWDEVRKRAEVLLVLDVSGSMGQTVGSMGETKLELAKQAAVRALGELAPDDAVGLWFFSSQVWNGSSTPWIEVSPISPLGPKAGVLREAIRSAEPNGGTALYATVQHAAQVMSERFDPSRIDGVVVLTDGRNEYADFDSIEPLLAELSHQPPERSVRVFSIAYGRDADMQTLQQISQASFGAVYDASDPATIDEVFAAVISNF